MGVPCSRAGGDVVCLKRLLRSGMRRVASSGAALVPMVQATDFRERHDATFRRLMDASWRGRVLLEGEMSSRPMIIRDASSKHATQVPLVQNDDVVQTLAA